jgi:hypothetical protein
LDELLLSRRLIEIVIAFTLLEAVALTLHHRFTGKGVAPREFAANLLSGLCLMLALRAVLAGSGWGWTAGLLMGAGLVHAGDLWRRWKQ